VHSIAAHQQDISNFAVLHALGGGCQLPIGAYCMPEGDHYRLHAQVVAPDGEAMVQLSEIICLDSNPQEFGQKVATDLITQGALDLLSETV